MNKILNFNNIKLRDFLLIMDILLIITIMVCFIIIYYQFKSFLIKEEKSNYTKELQKTENFIKMQIENNIKNVEIITKYLKDENRDIFNEIDFIESSYFLDNDFKIKNIFFPFNVSEAIKNIDLKNSEIANYIIQKNLKENKSTVVPMSLSIITGKQAISIITKTNNGFFINEIKIKKVFDFFNYTSLYKNSIIFILTPNSTEIIARSNNEIYPYYDFYKPKDNSIILNSIPYNYYISNYPLIDVDIVILTPHDVFSRYFNIAKGFFIIIIVLILFLIVLKDIISENFNYSPLKKFLNHININPLKLIELGNNFKEWKSLEKTYNENVKKIEEANKKIIEQYEEIQVQYEELEATYEELTNTNEELAQSNQNLVEMNNKLIESENNLRVSLKEKELLLKEVHHRVKNNLQLISSILSIQLNYLKDEKEIDFLTKIRNRIKTISLIHEDMYGKENLSQIDFSMYVNKLVSYLVQNNNYNRRINILIDIDQIYVDITIAIPLGLITNELIVNAMTHAFDNNNSGRIIVKLFKEAKKTILRVEDNGKGLKKDLDYENSEGFGFKLVSTLVMQLNGVMEIENNNGTIINIIF